MASEGSTPAEAAPCPGPEPRAGITTSTITVRMSSTISHPIATCPAGVVTSCRDSSPRSSTTVLATDSAMPSTTPAATVHPKATAMATPSSVATTLWTRAPGMATPFTSISSRRWKWRPTPNIRRTTPTSASWPASGTSPTKPGVWGPIRMPASR